jgi:acyl-CoA thioesterase-1
MRHCIIAALKNKKVKSMARGVIASFLGMFVMACSGCGGGSGATTPASASMAASTPAAQTVAVHIDAEGDSTMQGIENLSPTHANANYITTPNSAPVDLQADLRTQFGNAVTVENHGVAGTTACERVNGTPGYAALSSSLTNDPAQIVIGNWAINDANATGNESVTQYQQCLEQFVDTVRAAGKTPVLEEPNPVVGSTTYPTDPTIFDALPNYVAVMDSVAQEKGVLLIQQYAYIQSLPNWQSMLTDGVHPDDALYAIKARQESQFLAPLIKSLQ